MKRIIYISVLLVITTNTFGFKEAIYNKGLEIGIGYAFGGFGFEVGFERKINQNIDLYPWIRFGGIGGYYTYTDVRYDSSFGIGFQADLPISIYSQSFFTIAISPLAGADIVFIPRTTLFWFNLGAYGLFSFDLRKEKIPLSISFGVGPDLYVGRNFGFSVYWVLAFSFYIEDLVIQIGGNSKFAGLALKLTSISF